MLQVDDSAGRKMCRIPPKLFRMIGQELSGTAERKGPERSGAHNGKTRVQESILPAGSFFF
jgi:hypothetical protein